MSKSKAPGSLAISRDNTIFYFSWNLGESNYGDGQELEYRVNGGGYQKLPCGKKTTSSYVAITPPVSSVGFRVRGNKDGSKKWSNWSATDYSILPPPTPIVSSALTSSNITTFSSSVDYSHSSPYQFTSLHWISILVKDCPTTDGSQLNWAGGETGVDTSGYITWPKAESGWSETSYSYTRWFAVRSYGWGGWSNWVYAYHTYAVPEKATNVTASYEPTSSVGYAVTASWNSPSSISKPIDSVTVQYLIATPECTVTAEEDTVRMSISCPNVDSGWVSLTDVSGLAGKRSLSFTIPTTIEDDKCIFLRVNNKHDNNITYGDPVLVRGSSGKITQPSIASVAPGGIENLYTVTVNRNNSALDDAWVGVYFRTFSEPSSLSLIGVIPANETTTSCIIPEVPGGDVVSFGVKAFISDYSPKEPTSDTLPTIYNPVSNVLMSSDINWDGGDVPLPPKFILKKISDTTVQASWSWSWRDANQAELSWADHEDAWESTDEPQTYMVGSANAGRWNIAGLGIGTWYFRIRLVKAVGDSIIYGTYSNIEVIKLSSSPDTPALLLSDGVIGKDSEVTCYWAYVSTDGTAQMQAEVCEAFYEYEAVENPTGNPYDQGWYELVDEEYTRSFDTTVDGEKTYYKTTGTITYSDPIKSTATAQHLTLSVVDDNLGWEPGETHHLAIRVRSASGEQSEGWSAPVPVTIANEIHAEIDMNATTLVEKTIEVEDTENDTTITRTVLSLTELPLTIKATGAGVGGNTLFVIERAEASFDANRPDESEYAGFVGETIFMKVQNDSDSCIVNKEDLIGIFDDGGRYKIVVTVQDAYGQSDTVESDVFEVHWNHQAVVPEALVEVDREANVTMITVAQPSDGYLAGDVCDIYRLSADKPELIISGGEFGEKYVDPYPTLGEFGGHRVVYRTCNGDYITEDNTPAWVDYLASENESYKLDLFGVVIDFAGEQLILPYNVSVSNSWQKDFTETHYLGGNVQGDWNPSVTKTASITTVIPIEVNPDKIEAVRRLSTYTGICHVRTPDGSSYAANINVKDDREEKWTRRIAKISLEINRIDTEGFDGITYDRWVEE